MFLKTFLLLVLMLFVTACQGTSGVDSVTPNQSLEQSDSINSGEQSSAVDNVDNGFEVADKPHIPDVPELDLPRPPLSKTFWNQVNGPFGGILVDFVKSEGSYWAASSDNAGLASNYVYKIDAENFSWQRIARANNLKAIAVNPRNPKQVGFVTAAGWDSGSKLFLSSDGGVNWETITFPDVSFHQIAMSDTDPLRIYVGIETNLKRLVCEDAGRGNCEFIRPVYQVITSDDYGDNWSYSSPIPEGNFNFEWAEAYDGFEPPVEWNDRITAIYPHPYDNNTIFVGTNTTLAKTIDSGESWTVLSDSFHRSDIKGIAINPNAPNLVYVRVGNFVSKSCRDLEEGANASPSEVAKYCAGIYLSTNGGDDWELLEGGTGDPSEGGVYVNEYDNETVYAVFSREVLRTTLGSQAWDRYLLTYDEALMPDVGIEMLVSGNSKTQLFAVGRQGLYRTEDDGDSWIDTNIGFIGSEVVDIAKAADGTLFAATYDLGMFKSTDGGGTWSFASYGMKNWYVMQIATHPVDPNIIFITTSGGMYQSNNAGRSWNIIGASTLCPGENLSPDALAGLTCHYHGLIIDPENPDRLLVGGGGDQFTPSGIGLAASENAGITWLDSDDGFIRDVHVSKLVVDKNNPEVMYATTQGPTNYTEKLGPGQGVFKSTDHGHTWRQINNGLATLEANVLAIDPNNSNILFLGTDDDGLYKSVDAGASWGKLPVNGAPSAYGIGDIAVDPRDSNTIYIGTIDYYRLSFERGVVGEYGVFKSSDGGESFDSFNSGLDHLGVFSLELDAEAGLLYAGTRAGGVYWLDISE